MNQYSLFFYLIAIMNAVVIGSCGSHRNDETTMHKADREYTLSAKMTGYTGVGGDIAGLRNPILRAKKGERVKITIINDELMAHDVVMEKSDVRSETILEEGDTTSIEFVALEDDVYFCSIPGHREMMNGKFQLVETFDPVLSRHGYSPRKGGRPLNLGFERGTLQNWTAQGNAFSPQSVSFDPAPWFPVEMVLQHDGDFYVTSGGTTNAEATGTLTSDSFEIVAPWASFLIAGGALEGTRVELVLADGDKVFFSMSGPVTARKVAGKSQGTFRPVVVDLREYQRKEMYIRLVDEDNGKVPEIHYIGDNAWSHISFDDFRFHDQRPYFQDELRPEDIIILPDRDAVPHAGLSGKDAARAMTVPEGFTVTLAAAEPDIVKPIAMAMDHRGRLWVVESHTYPVRAEEGKGGDRILIFEDADGDGVLESRKLFCDGLNLVSGIEVGFGGVWVGAAPYLMFIPIDESGDRPAAEPRILLDGFGYEDTHETLNTFKWGPDGWLYGTHGIFSHSRVGKPGTPDERRIALNAGVWRYHPVRHVFEVFAYGTSNPWGLDFNDYGHAFITVCVIPHLYHVIQGGRYFYQAKRQHFNPYTYGLIGTIADHVHWAGNAGPHAGNFRSAKVGGGHAHAGAMFYLGNKHWGLDRNAIFMNNIHGHRVNQDKLSRSGSGYTASHAEDFIVTNDQWSLWMNFQIAPNGSVYVHDWYDQNQCHNRNPDVHNRTLGRIYRISHRDDKRVEVNLSEKTDMELVELQLHENDWYVRHARRLLQERKPSSEVRAALWKILHENPDVTRKLRALWALHVVEGIGDSEYLTLLDHHDEYIRSWALRLIAERMPVAASLHEKMTVMARGEQSALVRSTLASVLQRMALEHRWGILANLLDHEEDRNDHNIPLLVWYALEPMVGLDAERALTMAKRTLLPDILVNTMRRLMAGGDTNGRVLLQKVKREFQKHTDLDEQHLRALAVIDELLLEVN